MERLNNKFIEELTNKLEQKFIFFDREKLEAFDFNGTDAHYLPDAVVEPTSTAQISELMKLATKYKVPIIPRGAGTGLTGGALAVHGGVVLSLLKMNKILKIDEMELIAAVQPGVTNLHLQQVLENKGLYYPPDPGSYETSSIGGNIAEDAGGPHCFKYGTTRDYVLGMVVVLADGQIINTGVKTRKGVVGYDLNDLIIGSEGTLGIVTEATLRLLPLPQKIITLLVFLPAIFDAVNAMTAFTKKRIIPAAMEFMDKACLGMVRGKIPFPIPKDNEILIIIELDGEIDMVEKQMEIVGEICWANNASDVFIADSSHNRKKLWEVRRKFREMIKATVRYKRAEDVVVPISKIAELIKGCNAIAQRYEFKNFNYGHLGDGNIHVNLTHHEKSTEIQKKGQKAFEEIFKLVLNLGGTISGEHGIGITKKPFINLELSPESIRLQKEIKRIFDPYNILNPGKIFD